MTDEERKLREEYTRQLDELRDTYVTTHAVADLIERAFEKIRLRLYDATCGDSNTEAVAVELLVRGLHECADKGVKYAIQLVEEERDAELAFLKPQTEATTTTTEAIAN